MLDVIPKRFESPGETRLFTKGRFEPIRLGSMISDRDSWVVGNEPYVSLHLEGTEAYANEK